MNQPATPTNTSPTPVPPANDQWNWTTTEGRAHFDHDHAGIPREQWTDTEHEIWINLHLTTN